jgi:hypothetical protein
VEIWQFKRQKRPDALFKQVFYLLAPEHGPVME